MNFHRLTHSIPVIQNYFQCSKQICAQNHGFITASPLSALLSELCIQNRRANNMLNNKTYNQYLKAYFRRIDDTFILFKGNNR